MARTWVVLGLVAAVGSGVACAEAPPAPLPVTLHFDRFGGLTNLRFDATGYFHLVQTSQRDWLVDPDGHAFFSAGVNHVDAAGDADRTTGVRAYQDTVNANYSSVDAWADATVQRLRSWRFNTLGAWSDVGHFAGRMPYTMLLYLAQGNWHPGGVTDVFSKAWADGVLQRVQSEVVPLANDPWLVGYFTDNELRWTRDWTSVHAELFDDYMGFDATSAGKATLVDGLRQRYGGNIAAFDRVWDVGLTNFSDLLAMSALQPGPTANASAVLADKRAFLAVVAERYFSFTSAAIRAKDPNHLILGCRFVPLLAPRQVLEAAGRYLDVVSVNNYVFLDGLGTLTQTLFGPLVSPSDFLEQFAEITGRPIMVSEFGFRAADSGLPNTWPPIFPVYPNQAARADALESYMRTAMAKPYVVGLHWFEWVDEPAGGRSDGEDSNWGLVNADDQPYTTVVDRFRSVYTDLWQKAVAAEQP